MTSIDQFGLPLGDVTSDSVVHLDTAVRNALMFQGDPLADLDRALAADPRLGMAYVLKILILGLSTEHSLLASGFDTLATARRAATDPSWRLATHLAAAEQWLLGEFSAAADRWEELLVASPQDAIAMYAAHQADFLLGRSSELRDRVARRLPSIERGSSLEGCYLGMYAFGLEEMGDYSQAIDVGRRAVAAANTDAWALHAVAHVHEMANDVHAGERWLDDHASGWVNSNLAVHLWWHRALYLCDRQRFGAALELYDSHLRRPDANFVMELLDASALLWRLVLYDVDVGNRWQSLAEAWESRIEDGWYSFNDIHAMMAFAGAKRVDLAERLLDILRVTAETPTHNGAVARAVGLPVATGLYAYASARYTESAELLAATRSHLVRAGGSHAQRDVISQTLLSAAEKGGNGAQARALLYERLALRPRSTLNLCWLERISARGA